MGKAKEAIADFEFALSLNSELVEALEGISRGYEILKLPSEAEAYRQRALKLHHLLDQPECARPTDPYNRKGGGRIPRWSDLF